MRCGIAFVRCDGGLQGAFQWARAVEKKKFEPCFDSFYYVCSFVFVFCVLFSEGNFLLISCGNGFSAKRKVARGLGGD